MELNLLYGLTLLIRIKTASIHFDRIAVEAAK
jgi:hypothetical protein